MTEALTDPSSQQGFLGFWRSSVAKLFGRFAGASSDKPSGAPIHYKASIIGAITDLKDRNGSSSQAIKKHIEEAHPGKKFLNATYQRVLKNMVAAGDLVQVKQHYKLSAEFKKSLAKKATPTKKKAAPKKSAAPKMATPKKAAPKMKPSKKKVNTKSNKKATVTKRKNRSNKKK
eukprot:CAMPEP_0197720998 /NCGR_PEP_ID=MMETSP1434-20131217/4191_1 /TAXON_ID=265543 /ORGANISM="Minutocellus polymorphus, Strain CCMP3303" /LENGTH=173 /DNA_ID=CAMNT_0043305937 /DNA_START=8 /DNA_END=529 /DNA_ORIENTATION=-